MKSNVVLLVIALAAAGAFYIVWMNRASEKIISAVVPISVAAIVGVFIAVFVFGGEPPKTIRFPVTFFYQASDHVPLAMPLRRLQTSLFLVSQLNQQHPELMKDETRGQALYHHFLQRAIIEVLSSRYGSTWETEIIRFKTSTGDQTRWGGALGPIGKFKRYSSAEIRTKLKGNRFAEQEINPLQITFPPGTELDIKIPDNSNAPEGKLTIQNEFVTITIHSQSSGWGVLYGQYQRIMGYGSNYDPNIAQANFVVTIKSTYSRFRSGNPEMKQYRIWTNQLIAELQNELDEQILWQETKDSYSIQQLERLGPVAEKPMPLNPPQMNNPQQKTN